MPIIVHYVAKWFSFNWNLFDFFEIYLYIHINFRCMDLIEVHLIEMTGIFDLICNNIDMLLRKSIVVVFNQTANSQLPIHYLQNAANRKNSVQLPYYGIYKGFSSVIICSRYFIWQLKQFPHWHCVWQNVNFIDFEDFLIISFAFFFWNHSRIVIKKHIL